MWRLRTEITLAADGVEDVQGEGEEEVDDEDEQHDDDEADDEEPGVPSTTRAGAGNETFLIDNMPINDFEIPRILIGVKKHIKALEKQSFEEEDSEKEEELKQTRRPVWPGGVAAGQAPSSSL